MNTLTKNIRLYDTNGTEVREHTYKYRVEIDQYRSRTMSSTDTIQNAWIPNKLYNNLRTRIITRAIPIDLDEANTLVDAVMSTFHTEDQYMVQLYNIARNTEYKETLIQKITALEGVHEVTPAIASPIMDIKVYTKYHKMFVITNMMTDQMWYALSALTITDDIIKNAWATGDGVQIEAAFNTKFNDMRMNFLKENLDKLGTLLNNKMDNTDPRLKQLQEKREMYNDTVQMLENITKEIRHLEKEIVYQQFLGNTDKIESLKKTVQKMYEKGTISKLDVQGKLINITVSTDLLYTSPEDFRTIANTNRHNWYNSLDSNWQKLFEAIFNTGEVKLMIENPVCLNVDTGAICMQRDNQTIRYKNPHHKHYNCWGDYTGKISTATRDYDWETALTYVTIASAGINILDTPVMERMVQDLTRTEYETKCLKVNDEVISPKDWIRKEVLYGETTEG